MIKYNCFLLGILLSLLGCCQAQPEFCIGSGDPNSKKNIDQCRKGKTTKVTEYYSQEFRDLVNSTNPELSALEWREKINAAAKKNHVRLSYNPCTWAALQDIDENKNENGSIKSFYAQKSIKKGNCASGNNARNTWNREHVFPSGRFNKKKGTAFSDLHHLVAADKEVNSPVRASLDFGSLPNEIKGENTDDCKECKKSDEYFEPGDGQKGQVARILFYMDLRYEPDQEFTKGLSLAEGTTNATNSYELGDLKTLLKWHCQHEVTDDERKRNNNVQKWQGNRNPFIDFPGLVQKVYGDIEECKESEPTIPSTTTPTIPPTTTPTTPPTTPPTTTPTILPEIKVRIISAMPKPSGSDQGNESVTIKNFGNAAVDLTGWTIQGNNKVTSPVLNKDDLARGKATLAVGEEFTIMGLGNNGNAQLRNKADSDIVLKDENEKIVSKVTYTIRPQSGIPIDFLESDEASDESDEL